MLRIAVPNKGMLSEPAWNMLAEAGYRLRSNPRQLVVEDPDNDVELFYLRPLDIAVYVGQEAPSTSALPVMICCSTPVRMPRSIWSLALALQRSVLQPPMILRLASSKISKASASPPVSTSLCMIIWLSMASTLKPYTLMGAVESSVQLGVADLIADVVSTGTTLRNAGLRIFAEPLLHSEAVLIRSPRLAEDDDRLTILSRRLAGRAHCSALRAHGLRYSSREGFRGCGHHAWIRKPDGFPAS